MNLKKYIIVRAFVHYLTNYTFTRWSKTPHHGYCVTLSLPASAWLDVARACARPQFIHNSAYATSIHPNELKKNTLL